MNTSVNFQTAKLLKERGYGNTSPYKLGREYYNHMGELNGDVTDYVKAFINEKKLTHLETIDAPTISDVVMWLYEKHGVWIEVYMDDDTTFGYLISEVTNKGRVDSPLQRGFTSPTEAYERGIEWTLKNRI